MDQFRFRADGLSEDDVRQWHKHTGPSIRALNVLIWTVVVAVVYSAGTSTRIALVDGQPARFQRGAVVLGERESLGNIIRAQSALLIVDRSGSMLTAERQGKLQRQLNQLRAAGTSLSERPAQGFGVSATEDDRNLLNQLEQGLSSSPNAEAIYAFSDFENSGDSYWKSDAAGFERLRDLLSRRKIRLYLGSVQYTPDAELARIARESGGGVIVIQ